MPLPDGRPVPGRSGRRGLVVPRPELDPDLVLDVGSWDDLHHALHLGGAEVVVDRASDLRLSVWNRPWPGGHIEVDEPFPRLRAQDRRRLHRLGLRPDLPCEPICGTWDAPPAPLPPAGADSAERFRARLSAGLAVCEAGADKAVEVLRDGLRLRPADLAVFEAPSEDEDEAEDPYEDEEIWCR